MTTASIAPPAPPSGRSDIRADGLRVGQVSEGLRKWRKFKSGFIAGLCMVCAAIVVTPLALVFTYLVIKGAGSINFAFFTQLPVPHGEVGGGVVHAIVGSFILVGVAALIGLPTGILGALYVTEYAGPKFASAVRFAADLLNGVPSIVWGIVAYAVLVLPKGSPFSVGHYSAIAGSLALAFIMIPLVLRTSEEVLLLVPNGYREAALALGIAKWKMSLRIVLKTASKGILTGALLTVARVSGETAPLLFTALGNNGWSHSIKDPMAALPLQFLPTQSLLILTKIGRRGLPRSCCSCSCSRSTSAYASLPATVGSAARRAVKLRRQPTPPQPPPSRAARRPLPPPYDRQHCHLPCLPIILFLSRLRLPLPAS